MTREELREHCEKQVKACEMWAEARGEEPSGKIYEEHKLILDLIKSLEQQSSDDKVTITMDKGTLKYSGKDYVIYNKEWFRKHFATEVEIMTGYDGYNLPSEDCVSRKAVLDCLTATGLKKFDFILDARKKVNNLSPVTPIQGICKDCHNAVKNYGNGRIYCLFSNCIYDEDFYCKKYEKRGSENGI